MSKQLWLDMWVKDQIENSPFISLIDTAVGIFEKLMEPVLGSDHIDCNFTAHAYQRRKKKRKGFNL